MSSIQIVKDKLKDSDLCKPTDLASENYLRSPMYAALKERLYAFLQQHPNNYSAAARHFGLSRADVLRIIEANKPEFEELENEYLDGLEETVLRYASGKLSPKERKGFKFNEAIKLLALKRKEWAAKQGGLRPKPSKLSPSANGVALEVAKQFKKGAEHGATEKARREPTVVFVEDV